ncbi:hypothetical protein SAMN05421504_101518 [Amycolatopsis xylanica]|uniref:Uncharacterized protein n=1 Tax=Amycolatopsis xylanica TaxID=589385 RepID=A0A1H2TCC3_9PSEU|nr:hypothetical protein [Amycolatopsis xylanica]SDW41470.1 hypothetical protein SAMN05421504_101518 [Amycolatopsis xylanica]
MPDIVRHLTPGEREKLRTITSMNGVGRTLLSSTPTDASGAHFMTLWFTLLGPVFPIGRYYLRSAEPDPLGGGVHMIGSHSRYDILGRSSLVPGEVIRTYLYCWLLAPLAVVGPLVPLLANIDDVWAAIGFWAFFLVVGALLGLAFALVYGTRFVSRRWRKPRAMRWQ